MTSQFVTENKPQNISHWTIGWMNKRQIPFCFLELATSSNDLAKEYAFTGSGSSMVFLVNQQTKGRGQGHNKWENSDLMLSFLWESHLKKQSFASCEGFATDVLHALKRTWPQLKLYLKPPNDIYLEGKKVAGLLLEVLNQGPKTALILGLGFNVLSHPENTKSTCLSEHIKSIPSDQWESFLEKMFSFCLKRAVSTHSFY